MMESELELRMSPVGDQSEHSPERRNNVLEESRSQLVIEGEEVLRGASHTSHDHITNNNNDENHDIQHMYCDAKTEMLSIIESELKLKLEMRAIKEQFHDLLLTYLSLDDSLLEPRSRTPEYESYLLDQLPLLDDSGLQDSSTMIYSTDAPCVDSSTVEDTPTNRRMPRDQYLMLNEDGSRASSDSFESCSQQGRRNNARKMSENELQTRRMSMRMTCRISETDKETDEESGCYSRAPTYPGSDSLCHDDLKTSADASPDYSMEATKDSEVNLNDLTTQSSEDLKSMTDSSLHGMSTNCDFDESSYKESDAAWSPESINFPPTVVKVKRRGERSYEPVRRVERSYEPVRRVERSYEPVRRGERSYEPIRRNKNRRIMTERLHRQTSAATCSSTNSEAKLPYAPMNSPNSTAVTNDLDITNVTSLSSVSTNMPSTRSRQTISATSINQEQFDNHLFKMAQAREAPSSTVLSDLVGSGDTSSMLSLAKSLASLTSRGSSSSIQSGSPGSIESSTRPPCIGGESPPNIPTTPDTVQKRPENKLASKMSRTPLGKTLSMVKRTNSLSFKRFSKGNKGRASLGSSSSSCTSSDTMFLNREDRSDQHSANSSDPSISNDSGKYGADMANNDIDPDTEKTEKHRRLSKKFPILRRFESIRKHFRSNSKGKIQTQKHSESN